MGLSNENTTPSPLLGSAHARSFSVDSQGEGRSRLDSQRSHRMSSIEYDDMSGKATIIEEEMEGRKSSLTQIVEAQGWAEWLSTGWTEDGTGLTVALIIFAFTTIMALLHQNIDNYSTSVQWPLGLIALGSFIVTTSHRMLRKKQALEAYFAIFAIAVAARSIGQYDPLKNSGLSSSFWCDA